jgi:hypothetical protein
VQVAPAAQVHQVAPVVHRALHQIARPAGINPLIEKEKNARFYIS